MEIAPGPAVAPETVPIEAASPFEMRVHLGEDVPDMDVRTALKTGDLGFLHSFTTGSAVDGPGIRFVGFLTGCLLRCQYCHNPDTWHKHNGTPDPVSRAMRQIAAPSSTRGVSISRNSGESAESVNPSRARTRSSCAALMRIEFTEQISRLHRAKGLGPGAVCVIARARAARRDPMRSRCFARI